MCFKNTSFMADFIKLLNHLILKYRYINIYKLNRNIHIKYNFTQYFTYIIYIV